MNIIRWKEYLLGQYFGAVSTFAFVAFGENAHNTFRTFLFRGTFSVYLGLCKLRKNLPLNMNSTAETMFNFFKKTIHIKGTLSRKRV